jgi:hypothetical protein
MKIIKVSDFSKFPGPRYIKLGPDSGELFRESVLIPAMNEYSEVSVNLDDVFGYGSSFLEEAFGGLVRSDVDFTKIEFLMNHIISEDDPSLRDEIIEYITDELANTL